METASNLIKINFIYSDETKRINDFLLNKPNNVGCLNYLDIQHKLYKNDFYQQVPSDTVITSYLIKELHQFFNNGYGTLYYVLSTIDENTIESIKKYMLTLTDKEILFNMYHSSDCNVNDSYKLFNETFTF